MGKCGLPGSIRGRQNIYSYAGLKAEHVRISTCGCILLQRPGLLAPLKSSHEPVQSRLKAFSSSSHRGSS